MRIFDEVDYARARRAKRALGVFGFGVRSRARNIITNARARAKLEPYLGFLHSVQYGKPSLVCDLQELYRYLVDDFVVQFCQSLGKRDFTVKSEAVSRKRMGKREYLNDAETKRAGTPGKICFPLKWVLLKIQIGSDKIINRIKMSWTDGVLEQIDRARAFSEALCLM